MNYIKEYENETGNTITKVAARGDLNPTYYQPNSRYKNWELGARIMSTYYSNYRLIGYTLNKRHVRWNIWEVFCGKRLELSECRGTDDSYKWYIIFGNILNVMSSEEI